MIVVDTCFCIDIMRERKKKITGLYPDVSFPVLYGETEAALRKNGTPVPVMDLLIGISAKTVGMPLLTKDTRHYGLIPGLVVETY